MVLPNLFSALIFIKLTPATKLIKLLKLPSFSIKILLSLIVRNAVGSVLPITSNDSSLTIKSVNGLFISKSGAAVKKVISLEKYHTIAIRNMIKKLMKFS